MKKCVLILFLILIATNAFKAQNRSHEYPTPKFNPKANPFKELKAAERKAAKTDRNIILDVGGEWCIWCHRIDQFIEQNEAIKEFLHKNYIVVKINYSEENKNEKFLAQYPKVSGFPHFFVLDKTGKLLHSQDTGLLEKEKSYDAEKMMNFLKEWTPGIN